MGAFMAVGKNPGAMAFTRMPWGAHWLASSRTRPSTAALLAT